MGSRNGQAALVLWYAIQQRKNAFSKEAFECVEEAKYLYQTLKNEGFEVLLNDYSTTVVFPKPSAAMIEKWQLATIGDRAHFIVMQNHNKAIIDQFNEEMVKDFEAYKKNAA